MYYIDLAELERRRQNAGMTKKELGRRLSYSNSGLYQFLQTGATRNRLKVLGICRLFDCEPIDVLLWPRNMKGGDRHE